MAVTFAGNNMYQFTATGMAANLNAIPMASASIQPADGAGIKTYPATVVTDACNQWGYYTTLRGLGNTVVITCWVRRKNQQTPPWFIAENNK